MTLLVVVHETPSPVTMSVTSMSLVVLVLVLLPSLGIVAEMRIRVVTLLASRVMTHGRLLRAGAFRAQRGL
jgi:hypothetical protein